MQQELPTIQGQDHAALARFAKAQELEARKKFDVTRSVKGGVPSKAAAGSPWARTWKMVDGRKDATARPAAKGYKDQYLKDGLV